ncbi:hypothetical protein D3C72_1958660 [compost metagenome]
MSSCTSRRVPAQHHWPLFQVKARVAPWAAASRSASSKTMLADLPPSSRVSGRMRSAAMRPSSWPAVMPPVKEILRISGWRAITGPITLPLPTITLNTPAGRPASSTAIRASSTREAEVCSEGFATTVLPVARAGAMARAA